MLGRLNRLKGDLEGDTEAFQFQTCASSNAETLGRQRREFRRLVKKFSAIPPNEDVLERNAFFARDEFCLDGIDTGILLLLLRYESNDDVEIFSDDVLRRLNDPVGAIAALLAVDRREASQRIAADGPLIEGGLVCRSQDGLGVGLAGWNGFLQITRPLRKVMHHSFASREEWVAALVGEPVTTSLTWDDFNYLGPVRELAAKMMSGAGKVGASGVNLLLHGSVGTGKTEFAKALATHAGMKIFSIGETDERGGEPSRGERLAALKLAQRLLAKSGDAVILLDEAEDVLASDTPFIGPFRSRSRNQSKVFVNRMMERNPIPVIWTCNDVGAIDPAVLRRVNLAVEVRTPGRPARTRIWERVLDEAGLKLDADAVGRLSSRYVAPPAVAANAARAAMLSGGGEAAVEEAMVGALKLLGAGLAVPETDAGDFDPALINCDDDLARLTDRLASPGTSRQWSLCLYGPPGTDKSRFARYLADRLEMEVMQRRASDLLSMWVGGSKKQIAAAFQTARARHAMLIIDEADSLLSDRRDAVRSWEVTQVNELLTWMESHPLPFVCTTNLMDRLDQASLRRFTLKLQFNPFSPAQAALAFQRFFGVAAPRRLADDLTPGDFATVRRKQALLGVDDPSVLAGWLDQEAEAKGVRVQRMGFVAAG